MSIQVGHLLIRLTPHPFFTVGMPYEVKEANKHFITVTTNHGIPFTVTRGWIGIRWEHYETPITNEEALKFLH